MSKEKLMYLCSVISRQLTNGILFFIPIYFAWFQENYTVFDLNKSAALHALVALALVAWLVEIALSGRFVWSGNRRIGWLLLIVAVSFLISTIFSLHPAISLWGSYERAQGFYNLFHYLAVFFLLIISIRDRKQIENSIIALISGAGIVCAYGLLQALALDPLHWGDGPQPRIFSSFGQPNFLGHYIVAVLPLTIYTAVYIARQSYQKFIVGLLVAAELICLLYTYSRSAWLALLATLMCLGLWLLFRARKRLWAWLLIVIFCAGVAILSLAPVRQTILNTLPHDAPGLGRIVSVLDFGSGSNKIRLDYWGAAWTDITHSSWQRKIFGYGPDVQASVFVRYYQSNWGYYEQMNSFPDRAHNFIFDVILQFGLLGFVALAIFIGLIVMHLISYARREEQGENYWLAVALLASLLAYGVNNLFSFSLTGMNVILFGLLGMAWVVGSSYAVTGHKIDFFHASSRFIIVLFVTLLFILVWYGYSLKPLVADYYYFKVKKAEGLQNCRGVLDNMEKVMSWYPRNHYYARSYLHHGTNCFSAVTSDSSRRQLADNLLEQAAAIPDKEKQYYTLIDLAHMYSIIGYQIDHAYYKQAEEIYKKLIEISPAITVNYQDYGRLLTWQGRYAEAIVLFKKGIAETPSLEAAPEFQHTRPIAQQLAYFHALIGSAYEEDKHIDEAITWYEQAIRIDPFTTSPYKKLADLYYQKGDIDNSIVYNKKGAELQPDSSLWPFGLAALYKEKKQNDLALSYAERALMIDPNSPKIQKIVDELRALKK